jgi:PAS domain S-box-containing protein
VAKVVGTIRDISARRQIDDDLHRAQSEKEMILDGMPEILAYYDRNQAVMWTNKPAADSLGMRLEEMIGKPCYQLWHDRERPCEGCPVQECLATGRVGNAEMDTPDGRSWYLRAYPIRNDSGVVQGAVALGLDITDRRTAESKLRLSENRFRTLFDSARDPVFIKDKDLRYLVVNQALERLLNRPAAEVIGKTDGELFGVQQTARIAAIEARVLGGETVAEEITLPAGERRLVFDVVFAPMVDDRGAVNGICGIAHDITRRRVTELELERRESELRSILRAAPVGIGVVVDSVIKDVNQRLAEVTGYSPEEMLGRSTRMFYLDDDEFERVEREGSNRIHERGPATVETRWRRKDGRVIEVLLNAAPLRPDDPSAGVSITALNITARKQAEQARLESERQLAGILEGSAIPTFVIDARHRVTHWNPACELLTGIRAVSVIGTEDHWKAFYPSQRPLLADLVLERAGSAEIASYYEAGVSTSKLIEGAFEAEGFFPELGTSGKWLYLTAVPIRGADGSFLGAIETLQDITARKGAESKLRQSEILHRTLIETMSDGLLMADAERRVVYCNGRFATMLGYERVRLLGQRLQDYVYPEEHDRLESRLNRLTDGAIEPFELRWVAGDGRLISTIMAPAALPDAAGGRERFFCVVTDISQLKSAEARLLQAKRDLENEREALTEKNAALNELLEHLEREKAAFRTRICHDIELRLLPFLDNLRERSPETLREQIETMAGELKTLLSADIDHFEALYARLTPREREVCELIRGGKSSKDISRELNLSLPTVHKHREHIRRKLKLSNKFVNLGTYLHFR